MNAHPSERERRSARVNNYIQARFRHQARTGLTSNQGTAGWRLQLEAGACENEVCDGSLNQRVNPDLPVTLQISSVRMRCFSSPLVTPNLEPRVHTSTFSAKTTIRRSIYGQRSMAAFSGCSLMSGDERQFKTVGDSDQPFGSLLPVLFSVLSLVPFLTCTMYSSIMYMYKLSHFLISASICDVAVLFCLICYLRDT